ncbi:MAG: type III restriction-modification system endonuclease [Bacteroidales bacterium]|nr:type III restriction-modification system endonuclease [Bacteroidales bacterium]
MELILQTGLEHQQIPVDAIGDVFDGISISSPNQFFENPIIDLQDEKLKFNIDKIQKNNGLHISQRGFAKPGNCLNLDIKMETGTGKTYVYTHTIYELHRRYGINKFIIAVPTLPIKAGTQQFIAEPYVLKHFHNTCGYGADINLCVLNAQKKKKGKNFFPSVIRDFVEGSFQTRNKIYVLLLNMSLMTSAKVLDRDDYDYGVLGFYRPFDALRATKPFVIIDEPHRFSREQNAYKAIVDELKPQCIIRYGATFPATTEGRGKNKVEKTDYLNLLYDLNACDAFNQNLIKGVAKEHFEPLSNKDEKVKILSIDSKKSVTFNYKTSSSSKMFTLQAGESLGLINQDLAGLSISGIGNGFIELSNGQEKRTGEEFTVDIYSESYQEQMIRLAIHRHFETERKNFERQIKIKTLALFFIDNIESYRGDDEGKGAWLRDVFDRLLKERLEKELNGENSEEYREYLKASLANISACRAGYFAQDNNDSDEAVADEVEDILHNKKHLLSFKNDDGTYNTRRFLFSKWTLKEGWDNPNVFTIAKLRSSGSENSKIQEVGRGLRLPVDEYGNRIGNEEFMLNYIVDFTEKDFANKLVAQINGQLPDAVSNVIGKEEIERVAAMRGIDAMALMMELYNKKFITDINCSINESMLDEFFDQYPEFNSVGVSISKVIDRNKNIKNTVKIRKARFEELKDLWKAINKKYILFYDNEIDGLIEKDLSLLLRGGIFSYNVMTSQRQEIKSENERMSVLNDSGVSYVVEGHALPYNEFLKRLNRATSLPIKVIHKAMVNINASDNIKPGMINEQSLARIISSFNDWKNKNLMGRFNYKQAKYDVNSTALTNADGSIKDEIVQGSVGVHIEKGNVSEKYLYDTIAYDSDLELKNIKSDIDSVIVYGKIPRRSISIPTIANSTYSPDFMYVVKKNNGKKELNIIVETKAVEGKSDLRGEEQTKIDCAKKFFEQLKLDGYDVVFRDQLNNKQMATIISEVLME